MTRKSWSQFLSLFSPFSNVLVYHCAIVLVLLSYVKSLFNVSFFAGSVSLTALIPWCSTLFSVANFNWLSDILLNKAGRSRWWNHSMANDGPSKSVTYCFDENTRGHSYIRLVDRVRKFVSQTW